MESFNSSNPRDSFFSYDAGSLVVLLTLNGALHEDFSQLAADGNGYWRHQQHKQTQSSTLVEGNNEGKQEYTPLTIHLTIFIAQAILDGKGILHHRRCQTLRVVLIEVTCTL